MQEDFRKTILSTIKWSVVAVVAIAAFYKMSPQYSFSKEGRFRYNRFSGVAQLNTDFDEETGTFIYGKTRPISKFFDGNRKDPLDFLEDPLEDPIAPPRGPCA